MSDVYTDFPQPPYKAGDVWHMPELTVDYWLNSGLTVDEVMALGITVDDRMGGNSYVCINSRETGSFTRSDWMITGSTDKMAVEKLRNYPGLDDGGALPETTLEFFLDVAKDTILRRRFPFDPAQTEMPTEYEGIQLRMAVEMISKIGAEGQVAHAENNITREYASETISPSLLRMVVPKAGTL